jgi:TetR/AcrR family transcriptional regulator, cholesterol catabolism regulator
LNGRSTRIADVRRDEILASAQDAIRRLGLRRAGMRQIAREAGLSPGSLYYYFRNKEELVYFCQAETLARLLDVVRVVRAERAPRQQLAALIRGHLGVVLGGGDAMHLEFDNLPQDLYRKLVRRRDEYEREVRALIADGQRRGALKRGDPKLIAFHVLGAINWAARWFHPSGDYTVEHIAAQFAEQICGGIAK